MTDTSSSQDSRLPDLDKPDFADETTAGIHEQLATWPEGVKVPRVRDAATIILTRQTSNGLEILMGRRHARHKFLPNAFVFPGGRVDTCDLRAFPQASLAPAVATKIEGFRSTLKARALGLAGIRETFEETGIVIGRPLGGTRAPRVKARAWAPFLSTGHVPALDALELVFRAITPPHPQKRFDTWFFAVDIGTVPAAAAPLSPGSGELEELQWVRLDDAWRLDVPSITMAVLSEVKARFTRAHQGPLPIRFARYVNDRYRVDPL